MSDMGWVWLLQQTANITPNSWEDDKMNIMHTKIKRFGIYNKSLKKKKDVNNLCDDHANFCSDRPNC